METHEFTLDEVLKGKASRIRNKEFFTTAQYIEPFLERMSRYTDNFTVKVKMPDQITLSEEGGVITDDITFNRVNVEAILPSEYCAEGHTQVIGMVYGLDVRKPVCKLYSGAERSACTNLCVFSPIGLNCQEILSETPIDYSPITDLINRQETISKTIKSLQETEFVASNQNIDECLGRWIRNAMEMDYNTGFGKVKIGTAMILDAYKDLFINNDSEYFTGDANCDMFNIFNAFTQQITNERNKGKDVLNIYEKTILLSKILGIR